MFAGDLKLFGLDARNLPDDADVLRDAYKTKIEHIRNEGGDKRGGKETKELFQEASIAYTRLAAAIEKRQKSKSTSSTKISSAPAAAPTPAPAPSPSIPTSHSPQPPNPSTPPTFDVPPSLPNSGCSEQEMKALMGMFMEFMGMFDGDASTQQPPNYPPQFNQSANMDNIFDISDMKGTGEVEDIPKQNPVKAAKEKAAAGSSDKKDKAEIWENQAQNYTSMDLKSSLKPPSYSWEDSDPEDGNDDDSDTAEERRAKKAARKREKKARRKERAKLEQKEKEEEAKKEKELADASSKKSKILSAINSGDSTKLQTLLYSSDPSLIEFPHLLMTCVKSQSTERWSKKIGEELRLGVLKCLLRVCPEEEINKCEKKARRTALHTACAVGDISLVSLILSLSPSADLNLLCFESGWSPLHYSCANGHQNITDLLLSQESVDAEKKTDNNLTHDQDKNGVTANELVRALDKRAKAKVVTCEGKAMSEVKASKKSWESIITSLRTYLDVPPDTTKPPSTSIDTLESEEAETTGKKKAKRKKKKKSAREDVVDTDPNSTPGASPLDSASTPPPSSSPDDNFNLSPANSSLIPALLAMGFSQDQCEDAIRACGGNGVTSADDLIAWILENESRNVKFLEVGSSKTKANSITEDEVEKPQPQQTHLISNFHQPPGVVPAAYDMASSASANIQGSNNGIIAQQQFSRHMQSQQQQQQHIMMQQQGYSDLPPPLQQQQQPYVQPQYPSQQLQQQQSYLHSQPPPPMSSSSPHLPPSLPQPPSVPVKSPAQLAAELAESHRIANLKAKQREINRNWNSQRVKQQKEEEERKAKEEIERKEKEARDKKEREDEEKSKKLAAEAARIEAEMEAHLSATGGLYTPDIAQQHAHLLHSTQNTNPYAATANQELFHDPNAPMYYVDEYGVPVDEYGNPIDPNYFQGYRGAPGAPGSEPRQGPPIAVHDEEQFPELGGGNSPPDQGSATKKKKRRRQRRRSNPDSRLPVDHVDQLAEGDIRASAAAFVPNYNSSPAPLAPEFVPSGFVPAPVPTYVPAPSSSKSNDRSSVPEFIPHTPLPPPPAPVEPALKIDDGLGAIWGSTPTMPKGDSNPSGLGLGGLGLGLGLGGPPGADSGFLSSLGLDTPDDSKAKKESSSDGLWGGGGGTSGGLGGGIW
ncbi:hypothetical protein TrST_g1835 [Triparma strigata]|uniref:UBA domain-containing protein n=1 Tax=Triparma strigata TaxID=1606541 RepID=A0A9W7BIF4_9STRA|nr:hypothetical protein TrST_g1835 [Triparma strigata]